MVTLGEAIIKLVLLRHGESNCNYENRFGGWIDTDLSEKGVAEAKNAGRLLKERGYSFDVAFTSVLKRAIRTLGLVLGEMNLGWIPVYHSWRLNERHYGALQGLNKSEMAAKYGEEQVMLWRRSYEVRPLALKKTDKMYPGNDPKYRDLDKKDLPLAESLIISAHGNSLRALVKYLDNIADGDIIRLNIPTGIPLVYELDSSLTPISSYYLWAIQQK